ncbi:ketopantoate reductase family protein [Reinekea sp.]|jgi:2-dehydropantoate 2-reductase|uniref:ketopantoate reductase family protein n=1 Tax=Reinekea sp. TaxID=1970455 RepID=UPI003988EEC5
MNQIVQSLIVGPGAIGSLVCAHIQQYSQVWVYRHKPNLVLPNQAYTDTLIDLRWCPLENNHQPIDLIWLCSKAEYSLALATKLLTQHSQASVVLLHNGMGPQQLLAEHFPGRVIFAMTTNAVFKQADRIFHQKAFGVTPLGYPLATNPIQHNWVSTIAKWPGNMGFQADDRILSSLWKKLAMNAVVNPLTAYYQVKNGALIGSEYKEAISFLCHEIELIAWAENIALPSPLTETIYDVISLTSDNYSSMQQDIYFKRKTEIEFILGFLLTLAEQHQIDTPHLQHWYLTILSLQNSFLD